MMCIMYKGGRHDSVAKVGDCKQIAVIIDRHTKSTYITSKLLVAL